MTHPPDFNATAEPSWTLGAQGAACAASLRAACRADSQQQREAFHYNFDDMNNKTSLLQQLAGFLLMRGNYSWFGWVLLAASLHFLSILSIKLEV